jgi:hypothetical protein
MGKGGGGSTGCAGWLVREGRGELDRIALGCQGILIR